MRINTAAIVSSDVLINLVNMNLPCTCTYGMDGYKYKYVNACMYAQHNNLIKNTNSSTPTVHEFTDKPTYVTTLLEYIHTYTCTTY